MPTGYTHKIADGITFKEFAMDCARAFGACIDLRDSSEPIPEKFEANTKYHEDAIALASKELNNLLALSDDQIHSLAFAANEKDYNDKIRYWKNKQELKQKYLNMLDEVKAWEPPSSNHHEMKKFMMNQIIESIKFDCGKDEQPVKEIVNPKEWKKEMVEHYTWSVNYHTEEMKKEIERVNDRNIWIKQLRESLNV